jgi:P27 family predicted phage terminase small subunit
VARGRKPNPVPDAVNDPSPDLAHNGGAATASGPDMPGGLSAAVQEKWRQIVPLVVAGVGVQESDVDAIVQYCESVVLRSRALKELESADLILMTPNGASQVNPLLKIVSQCESVMMKLSERFGLDPASRQRLKVASTNKQGDPMGEFIADGMQRRKRSQA